MKTFNFKKIDAFATVNSAGNPAGYVQLFQNQGIDDTGMLQLAKELKGFVNEVGFLTKNSQKSFSLRFFSSECEVDFCGHATIAIMYDLISNDEALLQLPEIEIVTNRGTLTVENRLRDENAVFIMSPVPCEEKVMVSIDDIAKNLHISINDVDASRPVALINAGLSTLLVPVKSRGPVLSAAPDLEQLRAFCLGAKIDIVEIFTSDVTDKNSDYRVRVFAPKFGYLEDPATGSGNSALGYYLLNAGEFTKKTIIIEQNKSVDQFNVIKLQKKVDDHNQDRIQFGGYAICRLDGVYNLYSPES